MRDRSVSAMAVTVGSSTGGGQCGCDEVSRERVVSPVGGPDAASGDRQQVQPGASVHQHVNQAPRGLPVVGVHGLDTPPAQELGESGQRGGRPENGCAGAGRLRCPRRSGPVADAPPGWNMDAGGDGRGGPGR